MDLSIVIPVWNEAAKISADIKSISQYFSNHPAKVELIVVDDGSIDGTENVACRSIKDVTIQLDIIRCPGHRGKGYAVRQGILASSGDIVIFMDCGSNIPLSYIDKGMEDLLTGKAEIILGTRYQPQSKIVHDMIWFRRITSFIFRHLIKFFIDIPKWISDPQCGFKIFKGDIGRTLFGESRIDGFLFDAEVILGAVKRNYRMKELAIEWYCDRDSRLSIIKSFFPVLKEINILRKLKIPQKR